MAKTSKPTKKRVVKVEPLGRACIFASFNNVIISLTNNAGQVISWSSAGKMGFRGSKKNTPYAAADRRKTLRMPLRWLRKIAVKLLMIWA